jgi:hypothetical protein
MYKKSDLHHCFSPLSDESDRCTYPLPVQIDCKHMVTEYEWWTRPQDDAKCILHFLPLPDMLQMCSFRTGVRWQVCTWSGGQLVSIGVSAMNDMRIFFTVSHGKHKDWYRHINVAALDLGCAGTFLWVTICQIQSRWACGVAVQRSGMRRRWLMLGNSSA